MMTEKKCPHPSCNTQIFWSEICCDEHLDALPDFLREELLYTLSWHRFGPIRTISIYRRKFDIAMALTLEWWDYEEANHDD